MDIFSNLQEHFYLEIVLAQVKTGCKIEPNIEYYLVNLLSDLHLSQKPLFEFFQAAISGENKLLAAKALGDEALVMSSIFPEFAAKKGVSPEYCVSMGKSGYLIAAGIFKNDYKDMHFADVYQEMAKEFTTLQHVLKHAVNLFSIE